MDHSRFIAALIGPIMIAVGLALLLNPGLIAALATDLSESPALLITSGVLSLLGGLAIVKSHNVWKGWPIAVTLFGWLAVIGGAMRIMLPDVVAGIATGLGGVPGEGLAPFAAGVILIFACFFTWQGWLHGFANPTDESAPS